MNDNDNLVPMIIRWNGVDYEIAVPRDATIADAVAILRKRYPYLTKEPDTYAQVPLPPDDSEMHMADNLPPFPLP